MRSICFCMLFCFTAVASVDAAIEFSPYSKGHGTTVFGPSGPRSGSPSVGTRSNDSQNGLPGVGGGSSSFHPQLRNVSFGKANGRFGGIGVGGGGGGNSNPNPNSNSVPGPKGPQGVNGLPGSTGQPGPIGTPVDDASCDLPPGGGASTPEPAALILWGTLIGAGWAGARMMNRRQPS